MAWAPNYATRAELAAYVRITDSLDDTQLDLAIAAASRAVDRCTHRQFGSAVTSRIYTPRYGAELRFATPRLGAEIWSYYGLPSSGVTVVDTDDLISVSAVAVDTAGDGGFATSMTAFTLRPVNALADGFPYTQVAAAASSTVAMPLTADSVRVTGTFGWSAVPDAVKQATLMQASRILARRGAPFGVAGSPEAGSEMRLLAKVDPDVEVALALYVRRGMGFA
jgi:hypothetical protein